MTRPSVSTRRQFFNRGMVTLMSVGLGGFGLACIGFLAQALRGGFGGKIPRRQDRRHPRRSPHRQRIFYLAPDGPWLTSTRRRPRSGQGLQGRPCSSSMENGLNALYQKCHHLGCRVPKLRQLAVVRVPLPRFAYNRVGEKKGGPAPRHGSLRHRGDGRFRYRRHVARRARATDRDEYNWPGSGRPALHHGR